MRLFTELGLSVPIVAAPMAGGPTTPDLVVAADRAGGLGFLAAGYQSAEAVKTRIDTVRGETPHFGVNLFAPNPVPVDRPAYQAYRETLRADADRLGVALPEDPVEDDDAWRDKIDLLIDAGVPVVSFTFGVPERAVVDAVCAKSQLARRPKVREQRLGDGLIPAITLKRRRNKQSAENRSRIIVAIIRDQPRR